MNIHSIRDSVFARSKRALTISLATVIGVALAGCVSRIIPGGTKTDDVLSRDIAYRITQIELVRDSKSSPRVVDTRYLGTTDGVSKETWFIQRHDQVVAYDVIIQPTTPQGTIFSVYESKK